MVIKRNKLSKKEPKQQHCMLMMFTIILHIWLTLQQQRETARERDKETERDNGRKASQNIE